jgi:hypothetical protein
MESIHSLDYSFSTFITRCWWNATSACTWECVYRTHTSAMHAQSDTEARVLLQWKTVLYVSVHVRAWVWVRRRACSLTFSAFKAHAPYCHLWPLWLHHIFRRYQLKGKIFGKKATEHKKCVFSLSTSFICNISRFKKKSARYCHNCENIYMQSNRYSCQILMKFFSTEFWKKKKSSNIKLNQNPPSEGQVVPWRWTDTTKLIVAFRNFANALGVNFAWFIIIYYFFPHVSVHQSHHWKAVITRAVIHEDTSVRCNKIHKSVSMCISLCSYVEKVTWQVSWV